MIRLAGEPEPAGGGVAGGDFEVGFGAVEGGRRDALGGGEGEEGFGGGGGGEDVGEPVDGKVELGGGAFGGGAVGAGMGEGEHGEADAEGKFGRAAFEELFEAVMDDVGTLGGLEGEVIVEEFERSGVAWEVEVEGVGEEGGVLAGGDEGGKEGAGGGRGRGV